MTAEQKNKWGFIVDKLLPYVIAVVVGVVGFLYRDIRSVDQKVSAHEANQVIHRTQEELVLQKEFREEVRQEFQHLRRELRRRNE